MARLPYARPCATSSLARLYAIVPIFTVINPPVCLPEPPRFRHGDASGYPSNTAHVQCKSNASTGKDTLLILNLLNSDRRRQTLDSSETILDGAPFLQTLGGQSRPTKTVLLPTFPIVSLDTFIIGRAAPTGPVHSPPSSICVTNPPPGRGRAWPCAANVPTQISNLLLARWHIPSRHISVVASLPILLTSLPFATRAISDRMYHSHPRLISRFRWYTLLQFFCTTVSVRPFLENKKYIK